MKLLLVVLRMLCGLMSVLSSWKLTEGLVVESKEKERRINPGTVLLVYSNLQCELVC